MNFSVFLVVVVITTQFHNISIPNPQPIAALPPQSVSFGNHKFFKASESVSVLQTSLYPCAPLFFTYVRFLVFVFVFVFSRATPAAYGDSQARGLIREVAAGLHHSHSNARSEPCVQPTAQLTATLDP